MPETSSGAYPSPASLFLSNFVNGKLLLGIIGYCITSSTLLILNKAALVYVDTPNVLLIVQLLAAGGSAYIFGRLGFVEVDPLEMPKVKAFLPAVLVFFAALFTNMKCLEFANVEAVIVFRCSVPIIVAVCEYLFLDRELPSLRSWVSLLCILGGSIVYAISDHGFNVAAYYWLFSYLGVLSFDMLYVKYIVDSVKMTTWGRVYYNNILSIPPAILCVFLMKETENLKNAVWNVPSVSIWALGCIFSVAISFCGFNLRAAVSALSFTVIGVANKLITIILNVTVWDRHAGPMGIGGLLICMLGSTIYQQAPKKKKAAHPPSSHKPRDSESVELLATEGNDKD